MAALPYRTTPTESAAPPRAPAWFRYGVVAAAAVIMCSCRSSEPAYRVASAAGGDPGTIVVRGQSPDAVTRAKAAEIPTHLTPRQMARATALPADFCPTPCGGGCSCCGDHGPIRGPNDEYLCDGGDFGLPVGVRADWQIEGLEPEDTIAHYDTIDGRTVVTPSNKVCIYAPRFVAVRQVVDLRAYARYDAPRGTVQRIAPEKIDEREEVVSSLAQIEPTIHRAQAPPSLLLERAHPGELERQRRAAVALGTLAPYANLQSIRTGEVIGVDIAKIARASLAAITWSGDQAAQVLIDNRQAIAAVSVQTPGTIYHRLEPNNPKLRLIKLASTGVAQIGEEVEFTLRFDNIGDRVVGNVTIVDHLTPRLEYVADSQKSTVEANFSTQTSPAGSLTLRWEIIEPVQPGEGGILQFRTKVR